MSKKSIKNEIESLYGIVILGFIGVVFKFISILFSSILSGINFFFSSPISIHLIVTIYLIVIGIVLCFSFFPIFEFFYYKSKKFLSIKQRIDKNIENCNLLNEHIEDLKSASVNIKSTDFGISNYRDESVYTYNRPELKKLQYNDHIYDCSLSVCKNAQQQPFRYLCKYFDFEISEKFLDGIECTLNDYLAAEQGKKLLVQEQNRILDTIKNQVPSLLIKYRLDNLIKKLGFKSIEINQPYFPKYSFRYISPGGNSSMVCDIVLDVVNLEKLIKYIANDLDYRNSIRGQRVLMTASLRERIKERDNYTCQHCGLSVKDEPNLLLEIDHIIPISKGGKTEESNLQTLCWKCNRHKGNKIL